MLPVRLDRRFQNSHRAAPPATFGAVASQRNNPQWSTGAESPRASSVVRSRCSDFLSSERATKNPERHRATNNVHNSAIAQNRRQRLSTITLDNSDRKPGMGQGILSSPRGCRGCRGLALYLDFALYRENEHRGDRISRVVVIPCLTVTEIK